MSFNFPNSPVDGATFSPVGGPTYVFSGGVWKVSGSVGSSFVAVSDTAPGAPYPGMLWFESDTGALFFWYVDADSSQWVQINFTPSGARTAETRNRIVNGAMQISQENGSTSVTVGGNFPADQWFYSFVGPTGNSAQRILGFSSGLPNCLRMISGTAFASPAAASYAMFQQYMEGTKTADMLWGTASAKPAVLRFRARSSVNPLVFSVAIRNSPAARSFTRNFMITATNTYQDFSTVIPGDTTGTWPVDNTAGVAIAFTAMAGSSFIAPAEGVWQAGSFIAAPGISNLYGTSGANLDIAEVGLYADPLSTGIVPPFVVPDEAQELLACQRYWSRCFTIFSGNVTSAATYYAAASLPASPRIAPAFSGVNLGNALFPATPGAFTYSVSGVYESRVANGSGAGVFDGNVTANARM